MVFWRLIAFPLRIIRVLFACLGAPFLFIARWAGVAEQWCLQRTEPAEKGE